MKIHLFVIAAFFYPSCEDSSSPDTVWSIPYGQVKDGGPGKDGIPALLNPEMIAANEASYLNPEDLVVGVKIGNDLRAYPHKILDWHEIANDDIGNMPVAIVYCPLTGTAVGWSRNINGTTTTFGVSGLLYNANIIPYDRATDSNWSQIGLECVNGTLIGEIPEMIQVIETRWDTWQRLYPETTVVSTNTGFSRNYQQYPYGNYRTAEGLIFPISEDDDRLSRKERVLGVIESGAVKVYRFEHFSDDNPLLLDTFKGKNIVIIGSDKQSLMVAFEEKTLNDEVLNFTISSEIYSDGEFNSAIILEDQFDNQWDIFGHAIAGPNAGEKLTPTTSFMGYWFSWASFYPNPEIYAP